MTKEDFARALSNVNLEWGSNVRKMMEIFDSIDIATNQGKPKGYLTPSDISHSVLLNAGNNVDDILSNILIGIHRSLKQRNMLGKLRELFNFLNSKRDNTCTGYEFSQMLLQRLELAREANPLKEQDVACLL